MSASVRRIVPALLVVSAFANWSAAQDISKIEIKTIPVAENLYLLAGAGGNILLSIGNDGALLVDAGYEPLADKLIAAVRAATDQPIRLVVDTHWHFDHVGGNEKLHAAGALIVAQDKVRERMSSEQVLGGLGRRIPPSPEAARPALTFDDSLTLHWNGDEVQVLHIEPAHTDGDSFVYFHKANVLHVGDTWFNGMYPFIDVNAGGSIDGMIKAADRALELADDQTKIVPGHGRIASEAELREFRAMLVGVRKSIARLVKEGKSREQVIAAKPTKEFDERYGRGALDPGTFAGVVYDGMSKQ